MATIPFIQSQEDSNSQNPESNNSFQKSLAACFSLSKSQIDRIISRGGSSYKVSIEVYADPGGSTCGLASGKLLGRVSVPLDLRGVESRPSVVHNGWIALGQNRSNKNGSSAQLCLTVRTEPDPRFVFQFGGEPECSPQVFQVQGSVKQAVFTCKFGFRNSSDRNLGSRLVFLLMISVYFIYVRLTSKHFSFFQKRIFYYINFERSSFTLRTKQIKYFN